MKYMNNHFDQSRIFGKAYCKIPMNLQLFAESGEVGTDRAGGSTGSESSAGEGSNGENDTPSVEELVAQLAAERARSAKLQNVADKASSEAANSKKQLREKMTADEIAKAEEKAEREALVAEVEQLRKESRNNKYSKRYMGVGMDEQTATEMAELTGEIADVDKFFSALDKFVKAVSKKAGESAIETIIKNNPSVNAGNGDNGGESLAVHKAKELNKGRNGGVNQDILKNFM